MIAPSPARSRALLACSVAVVAAYCAAIEPVAAASAERMGTVPPPKSSSAWPARFPRTLFTAQDVATAKANAAARPASFNLLPWQTPIKDQGDRGNCFAFAFMAALEAAYKHKFGQVVDGKYQGQQWILSEEFLIHVTKSTLLNVPQTYLFENPSAYWGGVLGVVGDPMMISVLSEQLMNYRVPETQYAPYLLWDNTAPKTPPNSPPGLVQIASKNNCAIVAALNSKWVDAAPKINKAGQCTAGNCATQQAVDACEYTPDYIPAAASRNARFGVSFAYTAPDGTQQPGAKALNQQQMSDTDLIESLVFEGHEVIAELYLKWQRGPEIKTSFQTSPLWEYDASVNDGGHNMLVVGYDRSNPSPSLWYFIMKNSWGGDKYYFVSYSFMQNAMRGGVMIMDVVDPALDKPASLVQGGAWLGVWPVHRSAQSELDGTLVIRRTFDSNVPVQPGAGTSLQLGDYYPSGNSAAEVVNGFMSSDSTMVFQVKPPKPAGAALYSWTFGQQPVRRVGD
jgi:hypothetical protein